VTAEKVRENWLRRMAERQGLELRKSRRRDPRAKDCGRWYIVDVDREIEAAEIGGYDVAAKRFTAHGGRLSSRVRSSSSRSAATSTS
jgi:hypothetical protein